MRSRSAQNSARKHAARAYIFHLAITFAVLFAILAVLLALYMLKSALGIDVFKNFHVGIWTWFVNLHDKVN